MTTIAYRNGLLAADTLISHESDRLGYTPKIGRAGGILFGATGSSCWSWAFRCWVMEGAKGEHPQPDESSGGFVIMPDHTIVAFHRDGIERRIRLPFFAEGSGADYATGAMQAGATAEEAVRAAMVWDCHTGGEITVLRRA